jgi:hypothetical protein
VEERRDDPLYLQARDSDRREFEAAKQDARSLQSNPSSLGQAVRKQSCGSCRARDSWLCVDRDRDVDVKKLPGPIRPTMKSTRACLLSSDLMEDKTVSSSASVVKKRNISPLYLHDHSRSPAHPFGRLQRTRRKHSIRLPAEQRLQPPSVADWSAWT